jgi:hypothetical protein
MAESSPFLPGGGLADLASIGPGAGIVGVPPEGAACDPPLEP